MIAEINQILHSQPVLTLFLIIGSGYLIGRIPIGSFSFGPVAGVLFAGLFLGHFDFRMSPGAQSVGFALFIFSVGYQAGPRFFDVLKTDGLKYFSLAVVISVAGLGVAIVVTKLLNLEPGTSAGLLAGGLTSSPTLAAAQEALRSGTMKPPAGWTVEQMVGNVTTGYAITYIFGLAGLITIIKVLPGILGINLQQEAKELEKTDKFDTGEISNISIRAYRVTNEDFTKISVGVLRERSTGSFSVGRVRRDGEIISLNPDDFLQIGDVVLAKGDVEAFVEGGIQEIGEEIIDREFLAQVNDTAQIVVFNLDVLGKTLEEINIPRNYGIVLTGIRRMRISIPRSRNFRLRKGDILTVLGPAEQIDRLGQALGQVERDVAETDMVTFAFGIAAGVLIGMLAIKVGGLSIGLGSAGGLLTSGLIIGFLRSIRPTFGRMPDAARWIFMEFGLLLFMAGVGLRAGGDIIETFMEAGPKLVAGGIMVTTIPVLLGYLFGRKVLKINPVLLLGGITGSMTSGASLSVITGAAKSSIPALGYTGSYAFANVLLTIAGSIILLW
jgi:putative transport protein